MSGQSTLGWIPVSDRLPEAEHSAAHFSVQVLGYAPEMGGFVDIFAWWPASRKWTTCVFDTDGEMICDMERNPTHWMPLPEVPA